MIPDYFTATVIKQGDNDGNDGDGDGDDDNDTNELPPSKGLPQDIILLVLGFVGVGAAMVAYCKWKKKGKAHRKHLDAQTANESISMTNSGHGMELSTLNPMTETPLKADGHRSRDLPPGVTRHVDPTSRREYYYDQRTNETTWTKPEK